MLGCAGRLASMVAGSTLVEQFRGHAEAAQSVVHDFASWLDVAVLAVELAGDEGVAVTPSLAAARPELMGALGVRAVLPIELQRGRVEFEIDAEREVASVLDELLTVAPPNLRLIPLESHDDRVTVLVDWREPESAEAEAVPQPARDANPRD